MSNIALNRKDVGKAYFPFSCCPLDFKISFSSALNKRKRDWGNRLVICIQFSSGGMWIPGSHLLLSLLLSDQLWLVEQYYCKISIPLLPLCYLRLILLNFFRKLLLALSYTFFNVAHFEDISTRVAKSRIWPVFQTSELPDVLTNLFSIDCTCVLDKSFKSDWWSSSNCWAAAWNCLCCSKCPVAHASSLPFPHSFSFSPKFD